MEKTLNEIIIHLEKKMWDAFSRGDTQAFASLVLPEALMIIGGGRTTGQYYAQAIAGVTIDSTHLEDFQVVPLSADAALVSYLVSVTAGAGSEDLSGVYRVSSVWVKRGEAWKLIFNQDSPAIRR